MLWNYRCALKLILNLVVIANIEILKDCYTLLSKYTCNVVTLEQSVFVSYTPFTYIASLSCCVSFSFNIYSFFLQLYLLSLFIIKPHRIAVIYSHLSSVSWTVAWPNMEALCHGLLHDQIWESFNPWHQLYCVMD